jgi:hypothetical protein
MPIMPGERFTVTADFESGTSGEITLMQPENVKVETNLKQQIVNSQASWSMTAEAGKYLLNLSFMDKIYSITTLVTKERTYAPVVKDFKKHFLFFSSPNENGLNQITLSNKKILIFSDVPIIKDLPWINTWTWFGGYILFSLIFSMSLRKVFKVY